MVGGVAIPGRVQLSFELRALEGLILEPLRGFLPDLHPSCGWALRRQVLLEEQFAELCRAGILGIAGADEREQAFGMTPRLRNLAERAAQVEAAQESAGLKGAQVAIRGGLEEEGDVGDEVVPARVPGQVLQVRDVEEHRRLPLQLVGGAFQVVAFQVGEDAAGPQPLVEPDAVVGRIRKQHYC